MKLTIPNQLTILRIILTPVFVYFIVQESFQAKFIGTIIFLVASATDWYDGFIARRFNVITRWGQFMDPLADKILISSALFIYAYLGFLYWWMVIIIVFRDFTITLLRVYALQQGKSIVTSVLAKWKTFMQMTIVIFILLYLNFPKAEIYDLQSYPPPYTHWVSILFLLLTIFTGITGIQYLVENRKHIFELIRRMIERLQH
jgi:CDP-diacylglycerol--glycerol-3-phosphate 3-phosphatidyltransferase